MFESDLPTVVPISDALDLHAFAARDVKAAVEEYLVEAVRLEISTVRVIHGRGIGFQRDVVRGVLRSSPLVVESWDAPPERGGRGATLATLAIASKG